MTSKLVRKTIRMSPELARWFEDEADSLGMSQSNLMIMALSEYRKQQKVIEISAGYPDIIKQFQKLAEEKGKTQK